MSRIFSLDMMHNPLYDLQPLTLGVLWRDSFEHLGFDKAQHNFNHTPGLILSKARLISDITRALTLIMTPTLIRSAAQTTSRQKNDFNTTPYTKSST